jgi:hypothetical protein
LWQHYRTAALFCLAYPIVASRGMDFSDPRQYALVDSMNTRFDRAVRELSLGRLALVELIIVRHGLPPFGSNESLGQRTLI